MSSDEDYESFEASMLADEIDEHPACMTCVVLRPKHRLGRFRHRLWICLCGQGWHTKRGMYEKATWTWRRWPR
jgi:hypothetical protein